MFQQALNRHSQIVIPPETGFFIDFLGHTRAGQRQHVRRINAALEIDLPSPAHRIRRREDVVDFYETMARLYVERLGRSDVAYFGEKSPRHLLHLPRIHRYFPQAKILLIFRDGRDVASSLSSVPWGPSNLYVNFAVWLRFYRWQRWAMACPTMDLQCVKYEDFVRAPEQELRRIAEFLDLKYEPEMATGSGNRAGITEREREWKDRAVGKINVSRVELWRTQLTPEQLGNLERWGGEALTELGYELSTERPGRLPLTFFPRLFAKHTAWRGRCAWRLVVKEFLGR